MRYLAPFFLPAWLVGFPAALYWRGRADGTLPTEAEWESAAHSSGPWQHDVMFVFWASVLLTAVVHVLILQVCVREGHPRLTRWWLLGSGAAVLAAALSWWRFGYLMV